jgi:drug/metabolite transporter (DMT)-like permease
MDLFCPHCTRRVTIPDDKSGQVLNCPLCAKQFMAPSLAPPPVAPPPPPPPPPPSSPVETVSAGSPAAPPPTIAPSMPAPTAPPPAPEPELPPGDYTRSCAVCLQAYWLMFVPAGCMFAIFVLSFFTWHHIDEWHIPSLWGLSFISQELDHVKQGHFLAYTILMLLTFPLVAFALVLDLGFAPPPLVPLLPWKSLAVGLALGLTFLLLVFDYADAHLFQRYNPITIPEKLAIRLHFVAMLASFGMFWLHWRKRRNLPPPRLEAHW